MYKTLFTFPNFYWLPL